MDEKSSERFALKITGHFAMKFLYLIVFFVGERKERNQLSLSICLICKIQHLPGTVDSGELHC